MTYYIDRQTSLLMDIQGFILGFEFDYKLGRTLVGFAVYDEMGCVVKSGFESRQEAERYCQDLS